MCSLYLRFTTMRETSFIEQNKEKWEDFESLLQRKEQNPDELSDLYVKITDDLSHARTFYPNRSVRVYLNGLAQQLFQLLYKNKKGTKSGFVNFWKKELPEIVYLHRKEFMLSLFVFALALGIGIFSSIQDSSFPIHILGESYMEMTEENIASGDPMAVYKQQNEVDMFLGITLNNLRVAFLTFILGLFFAIGSIAILIKNGVMVGTFQWFFYDQDLFRESFLTIWVHGTLEISAIIIAGAAGIVMGKGLVFPGTYTRSHAFRVTARRGLKIMLGIAPIIIMAGFIEGFLTRYTEAPDFLRLGLILTSLTFILGYFVWYPYSLAKRGLIDPLKAPNLPPDNIKKIDYTRIKHNGEVFLNTITFLRRQSKRIFGATFLFTSIYTIARTVEYLYFQETVVEGHDYPWFTQILYDAFYMTNNGSIYINSLGLVFFAAFSVWLGYLMLLDFKGHSWKAKINYKDFGSFFLKNFFKALFILSIGLASTYMDAWGMRLLVYLLFPIFLLWLFIAQKEEIPFLTAPVKVFQFIKESLGKILGLSGILYIIGLLLYIVSVSPLVGIYSYMISENIFTELETANQFNDIARIFVHSFSFYLTFALTFVGFSFLYYSLNEIHSAANLKERIKHIGERNIAFGLEKERYS